MGFVKLFCHHRPGNVGLGGKFSYDYKFMLKIDSIELCLKDIQYK